MQSFSFHEKSENWSRYIRAVFSADSFPFAIPFYPTILYISCSDHNVRKVAADDQFAEHGKKHNFKFAYGRTSIGECCRQGSTLLLLRASSLLLRLRNSLKEMFKRNFLKCKYIGVTCAPLCCTGSCRNLA